MPSWRATRRASCRSSIVQQEPKRTSPRVRSGVIVELHRQTDDLVTLSASRAAATDESTPPGHGDDYTHTLRLPD